MTKRIKTGLATLGLTAVLAAGCVDNYTIDPATAETPIQKVNARAEYFTSPGCLGCENSDYVARFLEQHFTDAHVWCVTTQSPKSTAQCWEQYDVSGEGGANRLRRLYGPGEPTVPAIAVGGRLMSFGDVCDLFGYGRGCLDKK